MKKEVQGWLQVAKEDFESAKHLLEKQIFRMACYHSQQSTEKALKALIANKGHKVKRIHNLIDLKEEAKGLGYAIDFSEEEAAFLNSVYLSRYPPEVGLLDKGEPTKDDALKALKITEKVMECVNRFFIKQAN